MILGQLKIGEVTCGSLNLIMSMVIKILQGSGQEIQTIQIQIQKEDINNDKIQIQIQIGDQGATSVTTGSGYSEGRRRSNLYNSHLSPSHVLCRCKRGIQIQKNLTNINTQIQIHKYKFTNTNTQIPIHNYKYSHTNTKIYKQKYTNTNRQIRIDKYKYLYLSI